MTEPKQSFTEEIQKEAAERYKPFYNQSSYDENALRRTTFIEGANVALSILSRKTEGREFWILFHDGKSQMNDYVLTEKDLSHPLTNPVKKADCVHVIEYSALVAERAKLEFMNQNCISLGLHESRVQRLESEITTLRAQSLNNQTLALEYSKTIDKLEAQLANHQEVLKYLHSKGYIAAYNPDMSEVDRNKLKDAVALAKETLELQKKGQGE